MHVRVLNQMQWNIELIQLLCSGRRYLSLDKKSIKIQSVGTDCDFIFHTGSVLISCVFIAHFVVCRCACTVHTCDKTAREKDSVAV